MLEASATSPSKVSRANYGQVLHNQENYVKASGVRAESEQRRNERRDQLERFRQRGIELKRERELGQEKIKGTVEGCSASALKIGNETREQRERLRKQREAFQQQWREHGKQLTAQHVELHERMRANAKSSRIERSKEAQAFTTNLRTLSQRAEDSTLQANAEKAAKVKEETSQRVVRRSKQDFVEDNWLAADELRESLGRLRERHRKQEQEYLDRAHMIKANALLHSDELNRQNMAEAKARAVEIRTRSKRNQQEIEAAAEAEKERKKTLHGQMEEAKIVRRAAHAPRRRPHARPCTSPLL